MLVTLTKDNWTKTTLGDVAELVIGRTPKRKVSEYWTSDLTNPFLNIKGMRTEAFEEGVTQTAIEAKEARMAPPGALLMSFKLSVGRVYVPKREVYYNEAIVWIKPNEDLVHQDYLMYLLQNVDWTDLGNEAVKGKTLNSTSLKSLQLELPPSDEQERIVQLMNETDNHIDALRDELSALEDLRENILHSLVTGHHEIPAGFDVQNFQ